MISNYKVAWLLSYFSMASVSAAIVTPALLGIQRQFGIDHSQAGWMVSAFLMAYVFGQLIYGPLAHRFGGLRALRMGMIINIIGVIICLIGLALQAYKLLILGRVMSGLGSASGLVCGFILVNEWLDEHRQKSAIASSIFSFTIGVGIAVAIGGYLTEYFRWFYCFIVLLIHGLIMYFGTFIFPKADSLLRAFNFISIINNLKKALASKELVIFSLAAGFSTAITFCFFYAAPLISHSLLNISASEYGHWNLLNMLGMLVGGLLSNYLLRKFIPVKVVIIGLIFCAINIVTFIIFWKISAAWVLGFFINSAFLNLFGALVFTGSSYIASNAIKDTNSVSIMSFINLFTATMAVVIMPNLSTDIFLAFSEILMAMWLIVTGSILGFVFVRKQRIG